MSTLLVAAIIIGAVAGTCLLLVFTHNKQKRKRMNQFLFRFRELGSKHALIFSSQEILNDCILGLDGVNRKIAVLKEVKDNAFEEIIINIDEIKTCTVKKHYGTIQAGALKNQKLEQYLEKITLQFEWNNSEGKIEIPFYDHVSHHIYQLSELEQKARHWEVILSKMHKAPIRQRA